MPVTLLELRLSHLIHRQTRTHSLSATLNQAGVKRTVQTSQLKSRGHLSDEQVLAVGERVSILR